MKRQPALLLALLVLAGCAAPAAPVAPSAPAGPVVNRAGVTLPADAAPLDQQILRLAATEQSWMTWDASVYDQNEGGQYAWSDSCVRPDRNFDPQPNACSGWSISEDGLTWTFTLPPDKQWSDGVPITAADWVFTFQRYARPDYDFNWFYSMMNIENWNEVTGGELAPDALGVRAVDNHTFTITTVRPTPYLIKIMADAWVVPQHIVQDRLDDGTWAFDPEKQVFAGPYTLKRYDKGQQLVFAANPAYSGPFPPLADQIVYTIMEPEQRFAAYMAGELDAIGGSYTGDLPPAALAEIMADPALKAQMISWPNFITTYLFFDTNRSPFDDARVRQAFAHAIDRDKLVQGPLRDQAVAAYTMNPPGFPGESIDALRDLQAYDPARAQELLAAAGYAGGADFPPLTLYTRSAFPALTNAAEAMAAMLGETLGIQVEIQDLDYGTFMERLGAQKRGETDGFLLALVPYEFDFVDGSNMLGVWGGCEEPGTPAAELPGRHTWHSAEYNRLLCEAGQILGDEAARNDLYRQAERILIEEAALVPIYHGVQHALVKPDIAGPILVPDAEGNRTWNRYRFSSREALIYRRLLDE